MKKGFKTTDLSQVIVRVIRCARSSAEQKSWEKKVKKMHQTNMQQLFILNNSLAKNNCKNTWKANSKKKTIFNVNC